MPDSIYSLMNAEGQNHQNHLDISTRNRGISITSSSSSHTLRADWPDAEEFSRLTVDPDDRSLKRSLGVFGQDTYRENAPRRPLQQAPIHLDDEDEGEGARQFDLLQAELLEMAARHPNSPPRNLPILHPNHHGIEKLPWGATVLKPSKFLLLRNKTIFRIKTLVQHNNGMIALRGYQYQKVSRLGGVLEPHPCEYALILDVDEDDPRSPMEQCVEEIDLDDIDRVIKVIVTNQAWPEYSNIQDLRMIQVRERLDTTYIKHHVNYIVRWKITTIYKNSKTRKTIVESPTPDKWSMMTVGRRISAITEAECTRGCSMPSNQLRFIFRGMETILGGAFVTQIDSTGNERMDKSKIRNFKVNDVPGALPGGLTTFIDVEEEHKKKKSRRQQPQVQPKRPVRIIAQNANNAKKLLVQAYTYADGFQGAGGMTRGATEARFKAVWGFDASPNAVQSATANFPFCRVFQTLVNQFLELPDVGKKLVVDVLHLSPPCQFYSHAHTRDGQNDEDNTAALFCVAECLEKAKPRIVTLEETSGLLQITSHRPYFFRLVRFFTEKGFSVQWEFVQMEEMGAPQKRRRLIMMASCPGEQLPDFVKATHSNNPHDHLPPFVLPVDVLSNIPPGADGHVIPPVRTQYKQWDWRQPIRTIMCTDTISHPSGERACSLYEVKRLMGFPHEHLFRGQEQRRQIGNAVPPVAAKGILDGVRKHLEKVDRDASEVYSDDRKVRYSRKASARDMIV